MHKYTVIVWEAIYYNILDVNSVALPDATEKVNNIEEPNAGHKHEKEMKNITSKYAIEQNCASAYDIGDISPYISG